MKNHDIFKRLLDETHAEYQDVPAEKGGNIILFKQGLRNFKDVTYQVIFTDEDVIDIRLFSLANFEPTAPKGKILAFVNQANTKYRFPKVTFDQDGDLNLEWSGIIEEGQLIAENLVRLLLHMHETAVALYPEVMKLRWA